MIPSHSNYFSCKMQSLCIGFVWVLCVALVVQAQTGNYLLDAYETALEMKRSYDEEAEFFRVRLTYQADDYGYYFTVRMRTALERATTEEEGAALQICAATATSSCRVLMDRFDYALRDLEQASNRLHQTVFEQLIETNIKRDLDQFIYNHNYQMEEYDFLLNEVLVLELGERWFEMWWGYFDIAESLDECISNSLD